MKQERELNATTILQHGGYSPTKHGGHLNPPLYLDIAPVQPDIETAAKKFAEAELGFTYMRKGHENARILEKRLALLDGAEDALVFASGMAATNCLLLDLVKPGKKLITQLSMYGGTVGFLTKDFRDAGREVEFVVDPGRTGDWEALADNNTAAIWVEMPSNPKIGLVNLEAIAEIAKFRDIPLIVDSTFTPLLLRPLKWGATIVMRSGSKYENPGGTSLLGYVMGPRHFINPIRNGRYERYGATASPMDCWLAELGLRTLYLRMHRQSESALFVAGWLKTQSKVKEIYYPGLKTSPYFRLARKYLPDGCGAVLAFELKGSKGACNRFMKSLKIFKHVINLGDTRSLATYPAGTTHSKLSPDELMKTGITPSLIRLSVGLEDPVDLVWDLKQALSKC
ncbi:MAG: aminotransferase class I/II-fold pyridoxal phosphate-dependent enzyme [Candidatus Sungbacteria bacterium]|nr:aminotransferase class I/II-fold pyridoxal phosphate-dependent enzyme [Candidatus Sungbacteria bacterium]